MAAMTAVIMGVGNMMGGRNGMMIALIFAGGMNFFSYWYSDKIVLRMYKAREATPEQEPLVYRIVEVLSREAGLPMPKVYVIPQDSRPMPSPPAGTRKTRWWPSPKACCAP